MNLPEFFQQANAAIAIFNTWAKPLNPAATADHICYKCGSTEEFESLRALFETESIYIYQSIISKRRIAVIKFREPLPSALGDIWFLELSDQKPDNSQTPSFDHIEIFPNGDSVKELVAVLEQQGALFTKTERPHHTTYDLRIQGDFKIRIEPEALIEKIQRNEMM